jgi:hypothetical protein
MLTGIPDFNFIFAPTICCHHLVSSSDHRGRSWVWQVRLALAKGGPGFVKGSQTRGPEELIQGSHHYNRTVCAAQFCAMPRNPTRYDKSPGVSRFSEPVPLTFRSSQRYCLVSLHPAVKQGERLLKDSPLMNNLAAMSSDVLP